MRGVHIFDDCPQCHHGIMLGHELMGDRHALVLKCDRCDYRHVIPPGPITLAEATRWMNEDAPSC